MKKNIIISSIALFAAAVSLHAQSAAFDEHRLSADPLAVSMGGATLAARSSSSWTTDGNPAVLPFASEKADISFNYLSWESYGSIMNLGGSLKMGKFGMAFGASYGESKENIEYTDSQGIIVETSTPNMLKIGAGAGYRFTKKVSFGASVQYFSQSLSKQISYDGISAAAFVAAKLGDFKVSAGVRNLGSQISSDSGTSYSQAGAITVGGLWTYKINKKHNLIVDVEADKYLKDGFSALAGARYTYANLLSFGAGYHYGSGQQALPSYLSVGGGLILRNVHIDLTYLTANDNVGGSLLAGIGYTF